MKIIFTAMLFLITSAALAQSKTEIAILNLSKQLFNWEIHNKVDSVSNLLDEKFVVVNSAGEKQAKQKYLAGLSGGSVVHNNIDIEESAATVENSTGVVTGKGKFTITVAGTKKILHLSYMEVFTHDDNGWKLMALYASMLPN